MNNQSKPGINHIEFWVSDLKKTIPFYQSFLIIIGWKLINPVSFTNGGMEIYFSERRDNKKIDSLGIRHLCFQATTREQVDRVYENLLKLGTTFIRKP
jgi:catechol 2,3-dioxygenase-like lactoylglutathione lyase family enzyme